MKIIISSIYSLGNETGVAKLSEELWELLANTESVLYVCLGKEFSYKKVAPNKFLMEIPSEPVGQGFVPLLSPDILLKINKKLDEYNADLIHAHNIVLTSLILLDWSIKNSKPFVVTFHSPPAKGIGFLFPKINKNKALDYINVHITKAYLEEINKNIHGIITPNIQIKNSVTAVLNTKSIDIIPYGLNLDIFNKKKTNTKNQYKKFVYFGSYTDRKNQEFLIDVFANLPNNFKLELYGKKTTGGMYLNKLENKIRKSNIKNIKLCDFVPREKLAKILLSADYFVSASLSEAQSLSVIEALASGTPVIGLQNETFDELIDNTVGLKMDQNITSSQFANSLKIFTSMNSEKYSSMSHNCKEKVAMFSVNKYIERTINLYKKVLIQNKKNTVVVKKDKLLEIFPEEIKKLFNTNGNKAYKRNSWLAVIVATMALISIIVYPIMYLINLRKKKPEEPQ